MEICCANCKIYTRNENCPCNNYENCLFRDYGSYKKRGFHHNYYNHFVSKESAELVINADFEPNWPAEKEDAVDYKATGKALTAREAIGESAMSRREIINFIDWLPVPFSLKGDLFSDARFLPYALQHTCFRDFLLAGKYIEKVDTWVPPKMGDRFKYQGDEFMLVQTSDCHFALILTNRNIGNRWYPPVKVKRSDNITKDELQTILQRPIDELERI